MNKHWRSTFKSKKRRSSNAIQFDKPIVSGPMPSDIKTPKPDSRDECMGWKHAACITTGHPAGNSCYPTKDGHGGINSQVDDIQYYQCEVAPLRNPIRMIYGKEYSCLHGPDGFESANYDGIFINSWTGRPGCDYLGMNEDYCYSMYDTPEVLETGYDYDFSSSTTYCGEHFWNYSGTAASGCQPSAYSSGTEVCGTACCSCGMRTCSDQLVEWDCQNCGSDSDPACQPVNNATGTSGPDGGEYHPENYNGSWDHFANGSVLAGRSFNRTNCTWVYENFCSRDPEWTTVPCDDPPCQGSGSLGIIYPDLVEGLTSSSCCVEGGCDWETCPDCGGPCSNHGDCGPYSEQYCHSSGICVDYTNTYCSNNDCGIGDGDCDCLTPDGTYCVGHGLETANGICDCASECGDGVCGYHNCSFSGLNNIWYSDTADCCEEWPTECSNHDECDHYQYCHSTGICVDYNGHFCRKDCASPNYYYMDYGYEGICNPYGVECGIGDGDCDSDDECDRGACGTNNCSFSGINGIDSGGNASCCEYTCNDLTFANGDPWHDTYPPGGWGDDPDDTSYPHDCDWYANYCTVSAGDCSLNGTACEQWGDCCAVEGMTANDACCACGGGHNVVCYDSSFPFECWDGSCVASEDDCTNENNFDCAGNSVNMDGHCVSCCNTGSDACVGGRVLEVDASEWDYGGSQVCVCPYDQAADCFENVDWSRGPGGPSDDPTPVCPHQRSGSVPWKPIPCWMLNTYADVLDNWTGGHWIGLTEQDETCNRGSEGYINDSGPNFGMYGCRTIPNEGIFFGNNANSCVCMYPELGCITDDYWGSGEGNDEWWQYYWESLDGFWGTDWLPAGDSVWSYSGSAISMIYTGPNPHLYNALTDSWTSAEWCCPYNCETENCRCHKDEDDKFICNERHGQAWKATPWGCMNLEQDSITGEFLGLLEDCDDCMPDDWDETTYPWDPVSRCSVRLYPDYPSWPVEWNCGAPPMQEEEEE